MYVKVAMYSILGSFDYSLGYIKTLVRLYNRKRVEYIQ